MSRQHAYFDNGQHPPHGAPTIDPSGPYGPPQNHRRQPVTAAPGASYYQRFTQQPPPGDPADLLVQRITQSMEQMFGAYQAHCDARMNTVENILQRLSTEISGGRHEAQACVGKIAEVLQASHAIQLGRLTRLESILGMGPDMKDEKTLLNRFDLLSFAVEDLLERVKDPEANLPDGPVHHDMATSPSNKAYADAVVLTRPPSPNPQHSSVAVGSSSSIDDFSDSVSTAVADDSIPHILGQKLPEVNGSIHRGVDNDPVADVVHRGIPKIIFAAAPPVTRPLVPVDWQDQSPSPQRSFTFNPDRSPEGMEPFTVLPNQPPPSDGTVASLRHASLGDRFAGPLTSTPSHSMPVHAVSPAPSISPPSSPRQTTPSQIPNTEPTLCAPADDFSAPMVRRSLSPDGQETPAPPRESSVSAAPEGTSPSRPATVESDINMDTSSPSADTLREELAVLDMMETPQLDSPSNLSSPEPLPSMEDVIPSSATPSPMLSAQSQKTSPPRLTLSIPHLPTLATALQRPPGTLPQAPRIVDLFDTMSPLSPTTPSTRSPSARLRQVKSETETESVQPSPTPRTGPVLKLRSVGASSAAATRIKKRKGPPGEREPDSSSEPPSKRVRGRSEKKVPPPAVKTEKGKKKKKPIMWPTMTPEAEIHPEFLGKFIGCDKDKCDRWYHYSCLGIVPGDPRLEGTFDCPLCVAGRPLPPNQTGGAAEKCSRPDCPVRENFFEPLGVYGRYTKLDNTYGRVNHFLVLWKGYGWAEATWEPEPPSDEAVKAFNKRATAAGFDLDDDSSIMLHEAKEGGVADPDQG